MERIQINASGREERMRAYGRLVALSYLVAGLAAIPANLLIDPGSSVVYWIPLLGLVPGLIALQMPWQRMPEWILHVPIALGTVAIAAAATVSDLGFTAYYVLVAVFVPIVYPRPRPIAAHLALIGVGLVIPVLYGVRTGEPALILALLTAPTLVLISTVIGYLVASLEWARNEYAAQALHDDLTGVGNYRALRQELEHEIARHRRHDRAFALVVIDLNGFKQVNDRLGHLEGDRVLSGVGERLSRAVRGGDRVFRHGGDEFAILAPETGPKQADQLEERLRQAVAEGGATEPVIGCSGCAMFPRDGAGSDMLMRLADAKLRAAKREHYASQRGASLRMLGSLSPWRALF